LWQVVAETVTKDWNNNKNCMLVAGATYPEELKKIRELVGNIPLLVPGVGAQGGDVKAAVQAGQDAQGRGLIISTGRAIVFAENPAKAARSLRDEINQWR
jgi:orotidine-5'-phosphate decarboxylase